LAARGLDGRDFVRIVIGLAVAVLAVAGAAAWVVGTEPDVYLRARYPLEYEHIIRTHARNHDLDPALVAAVVYVESRFDPNAESAAGAIGLMQLLPDTARGIALRTGGKRFVVADLRDPEINVRYGTWYVDHLRERYGELDLALAAYHAGQGNVDHWREEGLGIVFPETRDYVDEVGRLRRVYADAYRAELGL
jgi:peptidoglycan lytic transglycosylase